MRAPTGRPDAGRSFPHRPPTITSMVTTRAGERRDVDAAARVAHDAYRHYTARIGRPPAPMDADYGAAVADGSMWIAEEDGRLLGFVVLVDADDHLLLENVAVDPLAQGRGVGRQLLALAEQEAIRRGHDRIALYTNEAMTENLDYYPRKGYVETHRGEQDGYRRVFFAKTLAG
jgi:GNAT superfamily N-acetyltransferase